MAEELARAGAALLGADLAGWRVVAGGDLSTVVRVRLADGREAVVKTGPDPRAEADMLRAIASAGVPAPRVLAVSDRVLVLEALAQDGRGLSVAGWAELGAAVRRLHDATGPGWGWSRDYAFGAVEIPNAPAPDWPAFWAERRLLPGVSALPADLAARAERLVADLRNRLPRDPARSLLHGDLWSGNVLASGGRFSGLIDPACHHGHAEVDLAMLHLFGAPAPAFYDRYGALEPGAGERRAIYQLWPALVHVRLFGGGYLGLVARLLDAAGV